MVEFQICISFVDDIWVNVSRDDYFVALHFFKRRYPVKKSIEDGYIYFYHNVSDVNIMLCRESVLDSL